MSKRIFGGLASVKIANIGENVVANGYELVSLISGGTFSATQAAVTTEERKAEDGSILRAAPSREPVEVTMNLADFGEETMGSVFNRTLVTKTIDNVECMVYEAKAAIKTMYKQLAVKFTDDDGWVWYPNLQTFDSMDLGNVGSEEGKHILTMKAFPDASGNVYYIVYPPKDVSFSLVAASSVTSSGATIGYTLGLKAGITVTENGIVYATTPSPTIEGGATKKTATAGAGVKSVILTSLPSEVKQYVRPYAIKDGIAVYGSEITFTTLE